LDYHVYVIPLKKPKKLSPSPGGDERERAIGFFVPPYPHPPPSKGEGKYGEILNLFD
jgi:hypothetical protein